jgi:hypothetical protein
VLRHTDEVADAVLLPAFLGALRAERPLLAQARRIDAVGGDAEGDEIVLDGGSAAIAENEVVFGGTTLVAAAFNGYFDFRMIAQEFGGLAESVAGIGADVSFVEVKVSVANFSQEEFVDRGSGRRRRRRRRWSCHGDADAGVSLAAGTAGGDRVGRGVRRIDFGRTLGRDGAYSRRNGELRGIGGRPAQRCGIATGDGGWVGLQRDRRASGWRRRRWRWRCHSGRRVLATSDKSNSEYSSKNGPAVQRARNPIHSNPPQRKNPLFVPPEASSYH